MVMSRHHLSNAQCHNSCGDRQLATQLYTAYNKEHHIWESIDQWSSSVDRTTLKSHIPLLFYKLHLSFLYFFIIMGMRYILCFKTK